MKLLVTGHRERKLFENSYDIDWISGCMEDILLEVWNFQPRCYAGMASGVDLYFCLICRELKLPYVACIPFDGQDEGMSGLIKFTRDDLIRDAVEVRKVKNSWMVEECDTAIAVWDGNKGGTHNVVQQLVEKKKNFFWINPVGRVVWKCFH